jgi:hypothetical protein
MEVLRHTYGNIGISETFVPSLRLGCTTAVTLFDGFTVVVVATVVETAVVLVGEAVVVVLSVGGRTVVVGAGVVGGGSGSKDATTKASTCLKNKSI